MLFFFFPFSFTHAGEISEGVLYAGMFNDSPPIEIEFEAVEIALMEKVKIPVDEKLLQAIKRCESGGNPKARNPNSSASGLYQFISSSWRYYGLEYWGSLEGKDVFNGEHNEDLARYTLNKYGTSPWLESKKCWNV